MYLKVLFKDKVIPAFFTKKTALFMKLTSVLILGACLQASATSYAQEVSISQKNAPLEKIFREIRKQTGYNFIYTNEVLQRSSPVTLKVKNVNLKTLMDQCMINQPLSYRIDGNIVIIKPKTPSAKAITADTTINISGAVKDSVSGKPMAGVTVQMRESTIGTATDEDGRFSLVLPRGAILEVSYLGYNRKTILVNGQSFLNISLSAANTGLNEVVVVGYGTQKKLSLTNSISQVEGREITKRPTYDVQQSLQGLAPGVTVLDQGGVPGRANATIRVRGVTSLSNNDALVIVDGIEQRLSDINPADIASISILKDAASTSIYGSRAANGVILVTTKRGQAGKVTVNLNTSYSLQRTINNPRMMDTRDYMEEQAIAYQNAGSAVPEKFTEESIDTWVNATDRYKYPLPNTWFQTLFHVAPRFDNTLSVSGGNEKFKARLSARYMNQDGLIPNVQQNIREIRANADYKISDKISVSASVNERYDYSLTPHNIGNVLYYITSGSLWAVPKYPDGTYGLSTQGNNPLMFAELSGTDKQTTYFTIGEINASWEIIKGLKLSLQFGEHTNYYQESDYANTYTNTDSLKNITKVVTPNSLTETRTFLQEYTVNNLLNYETNIGKHGIKALLGYSEFSNQQTNISAYRQDFYNNDIHSIGQGANDGTKSNDGSNSAFGLRSFFGRFNYSYNDKYLIEANARYDGSSRFTGKNQYSFFPSFSAGWRISEENFWSSMKPAISELKLRGSWGQTGNQAVGLYSYYESLSPSTYTFGGEPITGYSPTTLSNQDITWETTDQTDIGMDIVALGNLNLTLDYYSKRTSGILLTLPIPQTIGLAAPPQNAGVVSNKGLEIEIGYKNSVGKRFRYALNGNFTVNNNKILDLAGTGPYINGPDNGLDPRYIDKVGLPIDAFWGYKTDGLFQSQEEIDNYPTYVANTKPGDVKYVDINNDGVINADDYTMIGTSFPKYTYGLNASVGYANFELNMLFQGAADVNTSLTGPMAEMGDNEGFTHEIYTNNYWTPDRPNARFPRPIKGDLHNRISSDMLMLNASYIRLKNIQLVYNLPESLMKSIFIDKASLYVSVSNLFTISPLNEWNVDPETPPGRVSNYPQTSLTTLGLNIQF